MKFLARAQAVTKEAFEFVKSTVASQGKVVLVNEDPEEGGYASEDDENFFHEAPFVGSYGKHGSYVEYAILSLEMIDGEVVLHTRGRGDIDNEQDFKLENAEEQQIIYLADLLTIKEEDASTAGPILYPVSDEDEEYSVNVCRTAYGFKTIEVMAKSAPEAIEKALEEAGDHSFSEKSSEYTEDGVTVKGL